MKINQHLTRNYCLFAVVALISASIFSCNSDNESSINGKPYDPSKPIVLSEFYPDSGGMATKIIIKGENFGTDPSKVKVYYNKKQAAVVQTTGDMLYVITPRQPGDTCAISVVVEKDSLTFDNQFEYTTQIAVSTITGAPGGDGKNVDGTLAASQFERVNFLAVDDEKNIYACERHAYRLRQINEERNFVTTLATGITAPFSPVVESEGQRVFLALWVAGGDLLQFDPQTQWAKKKVKPIGIELDQYVSSACHPVDKMVYIKALNGKLARMDPKTKEGTIVAEGLDPGMDYAAFIAFDPIDPNLLYICYQNKHCIYRYNLATKEYTLFAGIKNEAGFADGKLLDAQFNKPSQICFDLDGIMFIADSQNHCIRTITREGIVTTVIGIPGRKGYVNGIPDDALFDDPQGVAVDDEGTIYIGDTNNRCIRKLAIQ